jgi:hypothetical protein
MSIFAVSTDDMSNILGYFTTRQLAKDSILFSFHNMEKLVLTGTDLDLTLTYRKWSNDHDHRPWLEKHEEKFKIFEIVPFDSVQHL